MAKQPALPWLGVQPGTLRHHGSIQSPSLAQPDEFGEPDTSWGLVRSVWASIDTIGARELAALGLLVSQVTHVIIVRWSPVPVAAGMRACFGPRVFLIQAVENVQQRNLLLKLSTLQINATGE